MNALPEYSICNYHSGNADELSDRWFAQLSKANQKIYAENLYSGRVFKEVKSAVSLLNANLLIASAGLGLIAGSKEVPPYNLTISRGNPDCVLYKLTQGNASDWWEALNRKSPFAVNFDTSSYDLILIAMSLPYYRLFEHQLIHLKSAEKSKIRLFIRANSRNISSCLLPYLMPYDERFDGQEGPNRGTLNDFPQRALRHFSESILPYSTNNSSENHSASVEAALKQLQPHKVVTGTKFSDQDISTLIKEQWSENFTSPTKMLRFFRGSLGVACEQKRFQRLFHEVAKLMEAR